MVRAILGQEDLNTRTPSTFGSGISCPVTGSTIAASIPKNGKHAAPGFVGVTPARGVMTWEPVSVCQYVLPQVSQYAS